jgi:hypothetical protein
VYSKPWIRFAFFHIEKYAASRPQPEGSYPGRESRKANLFAAAQRAILSTPRIGLLVVAP